MLILKQKNIGYSNMDKSKWSRVNFRMCVWVCVQRCKLKFDNYKLNLNIDDETNCVEEYNILTLSPVSNGTDLYSC